MLENASFLWANKKFTGENSGYVLCGDSYLQNLQKTV